MRFESIDSLMYVIMITGSDIIFTLSVIIFYLIDAAVLITDAVAVPIGSWLLSKDLWLPYWFSIPMILLAFPIIIAIPETASASKDAQSSIASQVNGGPPTNQSEQVQFKNPPFVQDQLRLTFSFRLIRSRRSLGKLARK